MEEEVKGGIECAVMERMSIELLYNSFKSPTARQFLSLSPVLSQLIASSYTTSLQTSRLTMGSAISRITKSTPKTTKTVEIKMSSETIAMKYYAKAQTEYKPPLIANENAFLGDVYSRYVCTKSLLTKTTQFRRISF